MPPRPQWKRLAVALLVGLAAAGVWLLPGEAWQAKATFAFAASPPIRRGRGGHGLRGQSAVPPGQ